MKKCKICKGKGLIQIAPNVRGLKECPYCKGNVYMNDIFNDSAKDYYKLQELVELLYYKIELNDEQQELLDNIVSGKGDE